MNPEIKNRLLALTHGVAHRGLHDMSRPENSRAAFENAVAKKLPFEFDLHLTEDKRLVVCHDSDLSRMCGKAGIIEELTLQEIKEGYRLPDGSELITLEELLEINPCVVPMTIELKAFKGNGPEIAAFTAKALKGNPCLTDAVFISFDANALRALQKENLHVPLGLLISTEGIKELKEEDLYEFDFLDVEVHYSLLPRFGRYKKKGGALLCWTVKSRFTDWIGRKRCHAVTWEQVDSAKPKLKLNRYIKKKYDPD